MPRSIPVYDLLAIESEILFLKLKMETDVAPKQHIRPWAVMHCVCS